MIEPNDYHIQIDWDEAGVLVVVLHKPSGLELRGRLSYSESVGELRDRLVAQIEREFYPDEDWKLAHYQISRDGARGGSWEVVHLPTEIARGTNTFDDPTTLRTGFKTIWGRLQREVVAEIWRRQQTEADL